MKNWLLLTWTEPECCSLKQSFIQLLMWGWNKVNWCKTQSCFHWLTSLEFFKVIFRSVGYFGSMMLLPMTYLLVSWYNCHLYFVNVSKSPVTSKSVWVTYWMPANHWIFWCYVYIFILLRYIMPWLVFLVWNY